MAKITLAAILTAFSSAASINKKNADIAEHLNDKVLYRDNPSGEANEMKNDLDMNSNRILNLPSPVGDLEPARWVDVKDGVTGVTEVVPSAVGNEDKALSSSGTGLVYKKTTFRHDTVADMTADTSAVLGQVWECEDYASGSNAGILTFKVVAAATGTADDGSYLDHDSLSLQFERIFNSTTSVKDFGAVGDGVTDDTAAIQAAIDYAKSSGRSKVVLGAGDFYHTGLSIVGATSYTTSGVTLEGNGKVATTLTSKGSVTDDGILISPESGSFAYNVKLRNFSVRSIDGQGAGGGIKVVNGMSGGDFYELNVTNFANDIWIVGTPFINTFTNLYCAGAPEYGFRMDASGTTNTFDNIFVFGATVRGYKLGGTYSNVGTLAADGITGDYAYEFNFFSGNIGSLGNESSDVLRTILASNSTLNIGYVLAFNNTIDDGALKGGLITGSGSVVVIENISINQLAPVVSTQAPFDFFSGEVTVGNTELTNITYTGEAAGSTDTTGFIKSNDKATGIMVSDDGTGRGYVGLDRGRVANAVADYRITGTLAVPKAIFLDSVDLPRFDTDGNDYRFGRPSRIGDIFLESEPANFHQAGWITTGTGSDLNACSFARLPISLNGTTASRPASDQWTGLQYFDTTLGQPVWWDGSGWVDATGSTA